MTAVQLTPRRVDKPWGRHGLWPGFDDPAPGAEPVGEVWFEDPRGGDPELLIKYLFTAEKLSIQVHPDESMARAQGGTRGKDEAWVVLAAEPGATIGIGTRRALTSDELRVAALDGSIEQLVDWKPVVAGDCFYSPAGTVHAIGAGVTLVEVQQNSDVTYRLYDYGRPRELHLDESVAAARPAPYVAPHQPREIAPGRTLLCEGPKFVLERWTGAHEAAVLAEAGAVWIVPLAGGGAADGEALRPGGAWLIEGGGHLKLEADADMLIAYAGADIIAL